MGLRILLCLTIPLSALAEPPPRISDLTMLDRDYMREQRRRIDNLARMSLGRQLKDEKAADLEVLQLIVDRKLLRPEQTLELQAMGIVLGNLLAAELGMQWVIYEDRYGRSRALRLRSSDNFLFPVTMISRRMEAGAPVDVEAIYDKARGMITPYMTPLPFQ